MAHINWIRKYNELIPKLDAMVNENSWPEFEGFKILTVVNHESVPMENGYFLLKMDALTAPGHSHGRGFGYRDWTRLNNHEGMEMRRLYEKNNRFHARQIRFAAKREIWTAAVVVDKNLQGNEMEEVEEDSGQGSSVGGDDFFGLALSFPIQDGGEGGQLHASVLPAFGNTHLLGQDQGHALCFQNPELWRTALPHCVTAEGRLDLKQLLATAMRAQQEQAMLTQELRLQVQNLQCRLSALE